MYYDSVFLFALLILIKKGFYFIYTQTHTYINSSLALLNAFKSFNAHLEVDYPAYAMVICQH